MFAATRPPKPHEQSSRAVRAHSGRQFRRWRYDWCRPLFGLLFHLFLKHLDAEISENRGFLTVSRGEEGAPAIDQENDEKRGQKQLGIITTPNLNLGPPELCL